MISAAPVFIALAALSPLVAGHASIYTESMWGLSVTQQTFDYDNRPVVPLYNMDFQHWWFHNHLNYPPAADKITEFPAGGSTTLQVSCDIGYTDVWKYGPGGDNRQNSDLACPGQPSTVIHANNQADVAGCAIGIAYKSNVNDVQPEDFVIFSVNYGCPWYLNNEFKVPENMPACPDGKCICAFFWIHNPDSGSEQMYMNGFQCKITGNTGDKAIGKPGLPRRCGADPANGKPNAVPSNCTVGPVNPMYWYQTERNNMFEDTYHAPTYNALYGFTDGAQPNLFQDATVGGQPGTIPNAPQNPAPPPPSAPQTPSSPPASSPPASSLPASSLPASSLPASSPPASSPSPVNQNSNPSPPANNNNGSGSGNNNQNNSTPPPPPKAPAPPPPAPPAPPAAAPSASTSVNAQPPSVVTTEASSTPSQKCKKRDGKKKKRSAVRRHLRKRLSHDGLSL